MHLGYNCISGGMYVFNDRQFREAEQILSGACPGLDENTNVTREKLIKGRFLIEDHLDEIEMLKFRHNSARFNPLGSGLVLAPHLNCLFACPYCYCDSDRVSMSRETIRALKNFVDKRCEVSGKIVVSWTGGEPLLVLDTVEELNTYFLNKSQAKNKKYECSMVTNGYLLSPEVVERLKNCGIITLQITLDGSREYHNRLRFTQGGGKTYDKIMENLVFASNNGLKIILRTNVGKENADSIHELIDDLYGSGVNKENLVFVPCMVVDIKASSRDYSENCLSNREYSLMEPGLLLYALKKGFKMGDPRLSFHRTYCGANTLSLYVIDAHANVLKCWCNLGRSDKNKIGHIDENGELCITHPVNLYKWMAWDPFAIKECLDCFVLPLCFGGCMYHNLMGETDVIDIGCSHRRHNLAEMIKLYYLSKTRNASQMEGISLANITGPIK